MGRYEKIIEEKEHIIKSLKQQELASQEGIEANLLSLERDAKERINQLEEELREKDDQLHKMQTLQH